MQLTVERGTDGLKLLRQAVKAANADYAGNILLVGSNAGGEREPTVRETRKALHIRFALKVASCKGPGHRLGFYRHRHTGNRRRMAYACWHAHRDVLRALLQIAPASAVVRSGSRTVRGDAIVYRGLEGFEREYPNTDRNIGSQMDPMYWSEACECGQ
jgi:hypothetical protein